VARSVLEAEIRVVHQANGTSEYAPELLLPLLPSIARGQERQSLLERYDPVIHAYHSARKAALRLYPRVLETLAGIRDSGCLVVAYTESQAFVTSQRILRLGLDGTIDCLYSPPDHDLPPDVTLESLRRYEDQQYELKETKHLHTPAGERKPSPEILKAILTEVGATPSTTVYIGDSRMKDVAMAQAVGVVDVWAEYGEVQSHPGYPLLRRVSHWSDEDVERERRISSEESIQATHTLESGFYELTDRVGFRGGG
jgi:phosphoglycolate phosphatase-like HAD superfamily hydrolase